MQQRVATNFTAIAVLAAFLVVAAAIGSVPDAWAGGPSGSINGKVLDPGGAGVPSVKVIVKNLDDGSILQTVTDNSGAYGLDNLPVGRYEVTAELANGNTVSLNDLRLDASLDPSGTATASASSAAAQIQATVAIQATQAPLVSTDKSQLNKTMNTFGMLELPGRHTQSSIALLYPGVVPNRFAIPNFSGAGEPNSFSAVGVPPFGEPIAAPGSDFSVNGTRPNWNYFTIDGGFNMDWVTGKPLQNLPPEAMQTFEMTTSNMPADMGRLAGSFVDQVDRTGSNGLHGTLMYTWDGNTFNSFTTGQRRDFNALVNSGFSPSQASRIAAPVISDQKAVASGGFPFWKNRIFSFSSWDRDWFKSNGVPSPTLALSPGAISTLQNGFSNLPCNTNCFAPGALTVLQNTFPAANVPTQRGQFNFVNTGTPFSLPINEFNPALAGGTTAYYRDYWRFLQRLDFKISDRNSLNLRYLVDDLANPGQPTAIPGQVIGEQFRNHSGELNDVFIFSPKVINEFRFNITRLRDGFASNLGMGLNIIGFNSIGNPNFPQNRKETSYQWADDVTLAVSHNTFRIGIDALRYDISDLFAFNSLGTLTFPSLADFLTDQNAVFQQFTGNPRIFTRGNMEYGGYVMDDIKVSKSLAVNAGLRYDYAQIPNGLFTGVLPSQHNFGPRFGFAWSPGFGIFQKTAIRGGYSLVYNNGVYDQVLPFVSHNFPNGIFNVIGPVSQRAFFNNPPAALTVDQFLAAGDNPNLLPQTVVSVNSDRRFITPYVQNYDFGIERELPGDMVFRAYYVGSRGVHLLRQVETNPGFSPDAVAANPAFFGPLNLQPQIITGCGPTCHELVAFRPNAAFGSIDSIESAGNSIYNAGQFSLQKRFSYGVQLGVQYTYSSFISDSDNFLTLASNPFDLAADRARSDYDQPHRFVANYIFQVPPIHYIPMARYLLSGWQISGITTVGSGMPYSVLNADNALGLLPGQNPNLVFQRAEFNPAGIPGSTTNPIFVANAPNSGIISNLGRNTLRTGRTINTDLALVKSTKTFSENQSIQFRFEVYNVFNHHSFNQIPFNIVGSSTSTDTLRFLNLGQEDAPGRALMLTARYFF